MLKLPLNLVYALVPAFNAANPISSLVTLSVLLLSSQAWYQCWT